MRDTRLEELLASRLKAMRLIKRAGMRLRMQHQHTVAIAMTLLDQRIEDLATDPLATSKLAHRHAPDMPVLQQTARANRLTLSIVGHSMDRHRILVIEFDLWRHALLKYKHFVAHTSRMLAQAIPGANDNTQGVLIHV